MKPEEAKNILSDMRDQHLCFLGNSEIKDEWQKNYLKEAWACDSGAKAFAGLITGIKIDKGVIADSIQPDKIALIELKEINGVPSLVIPVNGELKINGIEVELR